MTIPSNLGDFSSGRRPPQKSKITKYVFLLVDFVLIFLVVIMIVMYFTQQKTEEFEQKISPEQFLAPEERAIYKAKTMGLTFAKIYEKFGPASILTTKEKDVLWKNQYVDKPVVWTGELVKISEGLMGKYILHFRHLPDSAASDVTVEFPPEQKYMINSLSLGEKVTYMAKLSRYRGIGGYVLYDGKIISVEEEAAVDKVVEETFSNETAFRP